MVHLTDPHTALFQLLPEHLLDLCQFFDRILFLSCDLLLVINFVLVQLGVLFVLFLEVLVDAGATLLLEKVQCHVPLLYPTLYTLRAVRSSRRSSYFFFSPDYSIFLAIL